MVWRVGAPRGGTSCIVSMAAATTSRVRVRVLWSSGLRLSCPGAMPGAPERRCLEHSGQRSAVWRLCSHAALAGVGGRVVVCGGGEFRWPLSYKSIVYGRI